MTDETLLPCPFCGGEAGIDKTIVEIVVKCRQCFATVSSVMTNRRPDIDAFTLDAIKKWNVRTSKSGFPDRLPTAMDYMDIDNE